MNITKKMLLENSLISSIAHAIMTNIYPELSYEQSWDGKNYSFQNGNGIRGTLTLDEEYCVGAIRRDFFPTIDGEEIIEKAKEFPEDIMKTACMETLQYLLVEKKEKIIPSVSIMFWCASNHFEFLESFLGHAKKMFDSLTLFKKERKEVINAWKEYYEMDADALELLEDLVNRKVVDFQQKIILTEEQRKKIPGNGINEECQLALKELNIYFE